jgi:hydrogenase expression/formation protein HypC
MCLAVPGKIVSITEEQGLGLRRGKIDFGGVIKEACLAFTPEASVGDYVLVHVGFSLSVIDEAEAKKIFETLEEMQRLEELETVDAEPEPEGVAPPGVDTRAAGGK